MKTELFQSCGHCWSFQICWHIECSTFTASSFRIWNSSTGIPSPPLALFVAMLLRPAWLHIPGYLALGEWSHHRGCLGHWDLFLYSSSVYSCHLFLISSASVRSMPFLSLIMYNFSQLYLNKARKIGLIQQAAFLFNSPLAASPIVQNKHQIPYNDLKRPQETWNPD